MDALHAAHAFGTLFHGTNNAGVRCQSGRAAPDFYVESDRAIRAARRLVFSAAGSVVIVSVVLATFGLAGDSGGAEAMLAGLA
jgi:hypothetical protein